MKGLFQDMFLYRCKWGEFLLIFFFQINNENRYENDVQKIHVQQTMTIYIGRVIVYETNPL